MLNCLDTKQVLPLRFRLNIDPHLAQWERDLKNYCHLSRKTNINKISVLKNDWLFISQFFVSLLFLSIYSGHLRSDFVVLLLLLKSRSRRTRKADQKCPEKQNKKSKMGIKNIFLKPKDQKSTKNVLLFSPCTWSYLKEWQYNITCFSFQKSTLLYSTQFVILILWTLFSKNLSFMYCTVLLLYYSVSRCSCSAWYAMSGGRP